ncbi:MAG: DUF1963 domain-containing protein [Blastocatellia bacterium]
MLYRRIRFTDTDDPFATRVGGLPLLEDPGDWPVNPDTGVPLLLLASIRRSFLDDIYSQFNIPHDCCLSIFVCFDERTMKCISKLSVQSQSEIANLKSGAAKVLLHKCAEAVCSQPAGAIVPITMKQMTLDPQAQEEKDPRMPDRGKIISKVGGIPGWAQDPIAIPGYTYVLQLHDQSIEEISPKHGGIFESDLGFLFLKDSFEPGEAGCFFIQFT